MLRLEPLLRAEITLGAPQELGDTPQGRRRIIPITGGKFHGARLYGRVVAGGAKGDPVLPELYYMRTTPSFETSNAKYAWLNRIVCVGTGARRPAAVELEIFEVR